MSANARAERLSKTTARALLFGALAAYALDDLFFWRGLPNYPLDAFSEYFYQAKVYADRLLEMKAGHLGLGGFLGPLWGRDGLAGLHPPGYLLPAAALSLATGRSWVLTNLLHHLPYLAVLLAATYRLAARIAGKRAGLLAAAAVALYPCVFGYFRTFAMEFALAAVSAAALDILLESDFLVRRKPAVLFGAACAWGMLVKFSFAPLVAGPVCVAAALALRDARRGETGRARNLLLALAVAAAGCGLFFIRPGGLLHALTDPFFERPQAGSLNLRTLRFFTLGVSEQLLSPLFAVLLLAGFPGFWRRASAAPKAAILGWFLIPTAAIALMPHWKTDRLLLPHLPAFAVITGVGLRGVLEGRRGRMALAGIIALGLLQELDLTYGIGLRLSETAVMRGRTAFPYFDSSRAFSYVSRTEKLERARQAEALREAVLAAVSPGPGGEVGLLLVKRDERPPFLPTLMFWFDSMPIRLEFLPEHAADWIVVSRRTDAVLHFEEPDEPLSADRPRFFSTAIKRHYDFHGAWHDAPADSVDWSASDKLWTGWMRSLSRRVVIADALGGRAVVYARPLVRLK